jgi:hypothetical protein
MSGLEKVLTDETGYSTILSSKAQQWAQQIIFPTSGQTLTAGQTCNISYNQSPEYPNSMISDFCLKFRLQNNGGAGSTLSIPTSSLWSLISLFKIYFDDTLLFQYQDPRILEEIYYTKAVTNHNSLRSFLNSRVSTANIPSIASISDTRPLNGDSTNNGHITPYYVCSLNHVFDNLFKYRHCNFFKKITIEFSMLSGSNLTDVYKAIGVGATGSAFTDLQIRDIQLVVDLSQYKSGVPLLISGTTTNIPLNYFYRKTYGVSANTSGSITIDFFNDFSPISVINLVWLYWSNSAVTGALNSTNAYQIYNNSYITSIEVLRNQQRVFILHDAQVYQFAVNYLRQRANSNLIDSFYTSTDYLTKIPSLFVSLQRDLSQFPESTATTNNHVSTGINNDLKNGRYQMVVTYDLSSAPAYLDQLVVLLSTTRIITLHQNGMKSPEISY